MQGLDKDHVWNEVTESIKVGVSSAIYSTWFSHTQLISLKKNGEERYIAEIGCPSPFAKATLESRYFGLIQDVLIKTISNPCDLTFSVKGSENREVNPSLTNTIFETKDESKEISEAAAKARLRPGFTFENFAVSTSNQMAWAGAEAVAANPGRSYNPLFLWGGVGVGKTHLMVSVGYSMLSKDPTKKVTFCTGEEFTNEIVEGIRNKTTQSFRDKYRKLDCLLVDDIQFIAGKDAVQEEFFHTFNAVTSMGGQVILTSDRPPSEITKLEDRIRSRFEAGLIVDIAPPDFELRCAIVQIKATEKQLNMNNEIVQMIAANVDSARKIEGILTRISSEIKIKRGELDADLVTSILGRSATNVTEKPMTKDPTKLIDAVSKHYSINKKALLSHVRTQILAYPRQVLMYMLRVEMNIPYDSIGELIGGRDHTTVMHAVDKIGKRLVEDPVLREDIVGIKKMV